MPISIGYSTPALSTLRAIDISDKPTGYSKLVTSMSSWYIYNSSLGGTDDNNTLIAPNVGSGRWVRNRAAVGVSEIADLEEYVEDTVSGLLVAGSNVTLSYNDSANTLTINSTASGYVTEVAQDDVGSMLTDTATIDLTYNDAAAQITAAIVSGSIDNSHINASAAISQSKIENLISALAGKAAIAHTHDASAIVTGLPEAVQDVVGNFLIAGANIELDYNDGTNTLTISATASGGGGGLGDWDDLYSNAVSGWDSEY